MEERVLTKHPAGKKGVSISKTKYDVTLAAIKNCLSGKELTYTQLSEAAEKMLEGKFEGSIPWYVVVVKLDLEARGLIERIPNTRPQRHRWIGD